MRHHIALLSRFAFGLRFRLLLLVILACAPLVALTVHTAWRERRRAGAEWQDEARKLARIQAQEEEGLVGGTRQLLLALAESSAVRTGNRHASQHLLEHLYTTYPRYANLGVLRTNGEALACAVPLVNPGAQRGRNYFRRVLDTRSFCIGDISPARNGTRTITFGYPVFGKGHAVKAIVFAELDLGWWSRFGSDIPAHLPAHAVWREIVLGGTVLAQYASQATLLPQPFTLAALKKTTFEPPSGVIEISDSGNIPGFYAYATMRSRLAGGKTVGLLGIPRQILFAETDRTLARNLVSLCGAVALALLFGCLGSNFLVLDPVSALAKSSARVADGNLSARTGLPHGRDELGQLAEAFDRMAQALEHRHLEQRRASEKLQVVSRRLVEVQEAERRHIARELHDEIGQSLTAAEMNLQAALRSPGASAVAPRIAATVEVIEQVLGQVQDLSLNLRPSMLDDLGLEPALRWFSSRQAELGGLHSEFRADPLPGRLDPIIETECFRVAQEALTNVVRHAHARRVRVELSAREAHLHLSVCDDGIGFDAPALRNQAVRGASLGLLSMEERAALAGGWLEWRSVLGLGTEVHAWFPLKWRDEDNTRLCGARAGDPESQRYRGATQDSSTAIRACRGSQSRSPAQDQTCRNEEASGCV